MEWRQPKNVEKVECHFTWLVQVLNGHKNSQEVLKFVNKRGTDQDDDTNAAAAADKDDDYFEPDDNIKNLHPQNSKYVALLSMELIRGCKAAFLGNYEESRQHLKRVQRAYGSLTGDHDRLLRVFQYCVETLKWCLIKLEQQDGNGDVSNDDTYITAFRKGWEEFQQDDSHRAVTIYLKGRLEHNFLGYDENKKIQLRNQILDLDPDYYIWWTISYQEMRRCRSRRFYKRGHNKMKAPCTKEIRYCDTAYDLAPDILLCIYNKATLLKDIIFAKQDSSNFIFSYPRSPLYDMSVSELITMCLENLNKAERLAAEHGLRQRSVQIFLQKVDILTKDDKNCDNRKEGLRLLEEAIRAGSNNAYIHFKLGKVYHYGLGPERDFTDVNKARYFYERALEGGISTCTFTCIQSYIQLLPHLPEPLPVEETLKLLKIHNCSLITDSQRGIVTMWKGFLQWLLSFESPDASGPYKRLACMKWLNALDVYTERQKLLGSLRNVLSDFSKSVTKQQFIDEVKVELTTIRGEATRNVLPIEYVPLVNRFLEELQIWQNPTISTHQQNRQSGHGQNYRQPRHVQRGNGRSRVFQPSLADQSDNWRLN